jgi:hypothetical protein
MLETIVEMTYKDDVGRVALDTKTKGGITREWKKIEASKTLERAKPEALDDEDIADSDEEFADILD